LSEQVAGQEGPGLTTLKWSNMKDYSEYKRSAEEVIHELVTS